LLKIAGPADENVDGFLLFFIKSAVDVGFSSSGETAGEETRKMGRRRHGRMVEEADRRMNPSAIRWKDRFRTCLGMNIAAGDEPGMAFSVKGIRFITYPFIRRSFFGFFGEMGGCNAEFVGWLHFL
jgi:hypothetical protein